MEVFYCPYISATDILVFIRNILSAYMDYKNKKPPRINAPKWLFYMVGPDGQQHSPTLLFLLH